MARETLKVKNIIQKDKRRGEEKMKFVLITGPQAVGKMTVGQELVKITNLK